MRGLFEKISYAVKHSDAFYENDTKERIIVPLLCSIDSGVCDRIFRDCPDGKAMGGRRWDLQIKKDSDGLGSVWRDAFECKRLSISLKRGSHSTWDVEKWLQKGSVNGNEDPFLQVFLCYRSGKFVKSDRVWLTNGLKWILFTDRFFREWSEQNGAEVSEDSEFYRVVDFESALVTSDFELWKKQFGKLVDMYKAL